jgi:hypothetical protein
MMAVYPLQKSERSPDLLGRADSFSIPWCAILRHLLCDSPAKCKLRVLCCWRIQTGTDVNIFLGLLQSQLRSLGMVPIRHPPLHQIFRPSSSLPDRKRLRLDPEFVELCEQVHRSLKNLKSIILWLTITKAQLEVVIQSPDQAAWFQTYKLIAVENVEVKLQVVP